MRHPANAGLNKWIGRIAKEVAKPYETMTEREAATEFVLQHRLSIARFHAAAGAR
jgi:hypothetical protein